jgi:DNA repair protein RadD
MYTLRDYQQEATGAGVDYLVDPKRKNRNGIIVAPTGSGKSLLIASIVTKLPDPAVVFQPTREILTQNASKLAHYGYPAAVFSASLGRRERGPITLATIGSVVTHPEAFQHVRYVLIDECHQAVNPKGGQFSDFIDALPQGVRVLGFTATPYRLATNSMGAQLRFLTRTVPRLFNDVVHVTQIDRLVKGGFWAPLRYVDDRVPVRRERLKLNTKGTDFTDESVQLEFAEIGFVGQLCERVQQQMDEGRKHIVVFTRFVDEARRVAAQFDRFAYVTGETKDAERDAIVRDLRSGKLRGVANVNVLSIGFDFPELDCVILGCPSVSLARYYQWVGRAVRPHVSKPFATIVDMVGLVRQFGHVEDLYVRPGGARGREWTVCSDDRPLTNIYFNDRDGEPGADVELDPVAAKKAKRAKFWARKRRFGR